MCDFLSAIGLLFSGIGGLGLVWLGYYSFNNWKKEALLKKNAEVASEALYCALRIKEVYNSFFPPLESTNQEDEGLKEYERMRKKVIRKMDFYKKDLESLSSSIKSVQIFLEDQAFELLRDIENTIKKALIEYNEIIEIKETWSESYVDTRGAEVVANNLKNIYGSNGHKKKIEQDIEQLKFILKPHIKFRKK